MNNESEPNDSLATADSLALASPMKGQLASAQDRDLFAIETTVAGAVNVSIDTPTNSAGFDYFSIAVLDASGAVLSLYNTGRDATYSTGVPEPGIYYVSIEAADYHNAGDYELVATQSARAPGSYETEVNDSPETADPLEPGLPTVGQLATFQDVDLFALEATAAGAIEVSIDTPTNSAVFDYFSLTVLDASGSLLSRYATGKDASYITGVPEPGTYYLSIEAAPYHTADPYEVVVTQAAVDSSQIVRGTAADDLLSVEPGDGVVEAGGGQDVVQLPFLLTAYSFEEQPSGAITAAYDDWSLELNDVEFLEFGTGFQTTIPIQDVLSGEAQEQVGKLSDLYFAFFNRAPDIEGLEFWQEAVVENGLDLLEVSEPLPRARKRRPCIRPMSRIASSSAAFTSTPSAGSRIRKAGTTGRACWMLRTLPISQPEAPSSAR